MIQEEQEELLLQAVVIIEKLLDNRTPEIVIIARNFIEENGQDLNLLNA